MGKPMFRKNPPEDFYKIVLKSLGLENENDTSWITPFTLNLILKQEVLVQAKEFYYPCYIVQFLEQDPITYPKYITIANHFLKYAGLNLQRNKNGFVKKDGKTIYFTKYRISPLNKQSNFFVSFE